MKRRIILFEMVDGMWSYHSRRGTKDYVYTVSPTIAAKVIAMMANIQNWDTGMGYIWYPDGR